MSMLTHAVTHVIKVRECIFNTIFSFQVRDVRLIMDRNSRRLKGVGYASVVFFFFLNFAIGLLS